MSRFGDLMGGKKVAPAPSTPVQSDPVVVHSETVEEIVSEPLLEEVVEEIEQSDVDLYSMSKRELESYGRTMGIELDRRRSKTSLIQELEEHLANS